MSRMPQGSERKVWSPGTGGSVPVPEDPFLDLVEYSLRIGVSWVILLAFMPVGMELTLGGPRFTRDPGATFAGLFWILVAIALLLAVPSCLRGLRGCLQDLPRERRAGIGSGVSRPSLQDADIRRGPGVPLLFRTSGPSIPWHASSGRGA